MEGEEGRAKKDKKVGQTESRQTDKAERERADRLIAHHRECGVWNSGLRGFESRSVSLTSSGLSREQQFKQIEGDGLSPTDR